MAYTFDDNKAGLLQIALTDAGVTMANGSSAIPPPPAVLGGIQRAFDPTFGGGEFIMLLGVASTVVGSLVTYNATTYQTALSPTTGNTAQPVAVAMSACTAGLFGWYQIAGNAVIKKTAVAVTPQVSVFLSATAGRVKVLASAGLQVLGARSANLTTVASATSTVTVTINRPHLQGQIT